jgi:probable rRNA maturation factor
VKKNVPFSLFIQYPDTRLKEVASRSQIRRWVAASLEQPAFLTLRFVDEKEGKEINYTFSGKDSATNVLTFIYDPLPPEGEVQASPETVHADIIICSDVVLAEAAEQGKTSKDHLAHLIVHGTLHAQSFDHENENDATQMEALEALILSRFGVADPYA